MRSSNRRRPEKLHGKGQIPKKMKTSSDATPLVQNPRCEMDAAQAGGTSNGPGSSSKEQRKVCLEMVDLLVKLKK